jgi:TatD DNase family protein
MIVDSHCHLNYPQFSDLDGVIARARDAGVSVMQTISTKRSDFAEVKAIAETYPQVYCSIGIHPHEADSHLDVSEAILLQEATHPRVIGIGETGLDYFYEHSARAAQQDMFRRHIAVGRALGLPVIVHSRDADEDTVSILQEEYAKGAFTFLIHCFSSTKYLADKSIEIGGYISLSGIITFKKSDALRTIASEIDISRLLVETDAPYLAPVPHRGKVAEPAHTKHTLEKLAEIKGCSPEMVAKATTDNFFALFTKAKQADL